MSTKLFGPQDAAVLVSVPMMTAIAWTLPERYWLPLCRRLGRFAIPALTDNPDSLLQLIGQTVGDRIPTQSPEAILSEVASEQILSRFQLLKDYRPDGWKPSIQLVGGQHIETALQKGHGVILWVGFFVFGELVAKMAFHQAGLAVNHLSSVTHGFSSTRFGMRYLNPIQTTLEKRYLAERILLPPNNPTQTMFTLADKLGHNQIVSITVHKNSKTPKKVKFLDGYLYLAPGAPVLSRQTKAALLPVFPLRNETGDFTVIIEPPLEVPDDLSDRKAIAQITQYYAELLEGYVLKFPGQWLGWLHLGSE